MVPPPLQLAPRVYEMDIALFQGIYAPQDNIDDYVNDMMLSDDLVLETVHNGVGRPYNTDISASTETLFGDDI